MPYIPQDQRDEVKRTGWLDTPGKVAFVALQAAMDYIKTQAPVCNWEIYSNAHKALVAAEREFYRRHLAPYEDDAVRRNGDIY